MKTLKKWLQKFHRGIIYPPFNDPISYRPLKIKNHTLQLLAGFFPGLFASKYDWCVNERIVEIPFVFGHLKLPTGSKILDFGCDASRTSMHLANFGYKVVGADMLKYKFSHPNFDFRQGDFTSYELEANSFDGVVAISAIEHIGLGAYGDDRTTTRKDILVVEEFARILKPGGRLLMSVPFGIKRELKKFRIYDSVELGTLLAPFDRDTCLYYRCEQRKFWFPSSAEELESSPQADGKFEGVAMISAISRGT